MKKLLLLSSIGSVSFCSFSYAAVKLSYIYNQSSHIIYLIGCPSRGHCQVVEWDPVKKTMSRSVDINKKFDGIHLGKNEYISNSISIFDEGRGLLFSSKDHDVFGRIKTWDVNLTLNKNRKMQAKENFIFDGLSLLGLKNLNTPNNFSFSRLLRTASILSDNNNLTLFYKGRRYSHLYPKGISLKSNQFNLSDLADKEGKINELDLVVSYKVQGHQHTLYFRGSKVIEVIDRVKKSERLVSEFLKSYHKIGKRLDSVISSPQPALPVYSIYGNSEDENIPVEKAYKDLNDDKGKPSWLPSDLPLKIIYHHVHMMIGTKSGPYNCSSAAEIFSGGQCFRLSVKFSSLPYGYGLYEAPGEEGDIPELGSSNLSFFIGRAFKITYKGSNGDEKTVNGNILGEQVDYLGPNVIKKIEMGSCETEDDCASYIYFYLYSDEPLDESFFSDNAIKSMYLVKSKHGAQNFSSYRKYRLPYSPHLWHKMADLKYFTVLDDSQRTIDHPISVRSKDAGYPHLPTYYFNGQYFEDDTDFIPGYQLPYGFIQQTGYDRGPETYATLLEKVETIYENVDLSSSLMQHNITLPLSDLPAAYQDHPEQLIGRVMSLLCFLSPESSGWNEKQSVIFQIIDVHVDQDAGTIDIYGANDLLHRTPNGRFNEYPKQSPHLERWTAYLNKRMSQSAVYQMNILDPSKGVDVNNPGYKCENKGGRFEYEAKSEPPYFCTKNIKPAIDENAHPVREFSLLPYFDTRQQYLSFEDVGVTLKDPMPPEEDEKITITKDKTSDLYIWNWAVPGKLRTCDSLLLGYRGLMDQCFTITFNPSDLPKTYQDQPGYLTDKAFTVVQSDHANVDAVAYDYSYNEDKDKLTLYMTADRNNDIYPVEFEELVHNKNDQIKYPQPNELFYNPTSTVLALNNNIGFKFITDKKYNINYWTETPPVGSDHICHSDRSHKYSHGIKGLGCEVVSIKRDLFKGYYSDHLSDMKGLTLKVFSPTTHAGPACDEATDKDYTQATGHYAVIHAITTDGDNMVKLWIEGYYVRHNGYNLAKLVGDDPYDPDQRYAKNYDVCNKFHYIITDWEVPKLRE